MTPGVPPAEVEIDDRLVRTLLAAQHPDLADLPLHHAATGWDNVMYRLGDDLGVRLPRIGDAVALLRQEHRWLPLLAEGLPVPVPTPVRTGAPGDGYPWPWSIVRWVPGRCADQEPLAASQAAVLGGFLAALHRPAGAEFPRNTWRGVPLTACTGSIEPRLEDLERLETGLRVPLSAVRERWAEALETPVDLPATRVHADLHPKNIVVDGGRLAAVIDWGDMTAGDPAIDLAAAWMLFPADRHAALWDAYGPISAPTMTRAVGWAIYFGVTILHSRLVEDPAFAQVGRAALERACGR